MQATLTTDPVIHVDERAPTVSVSYPPASKEAERAPEAAPTPASSVEAPSPQGALGIVDQLLRDRRALLARIQSGEDLQQIARVMLVTIVASSMVFGAAVGFYRGGEQIVYAAIKFPLVILFTAALCAPAFSALQKVVAGKTDVRSDIALTLSSLALGSLFMAALAPVLLLAIMLDVDYHPLTLLTVACSAVGGLTGVTLFVRGVRGESLLRRLVTGAALFVVVALVGTQMSWTLRPYLVRPRTEEVPFVRALEGSFLEAVGRSTLSSFEIYTREIPGEEPTWEEQPLLEAPSSDWQSYPSESTRQQDGRWR